MVAILIGIYLVGYAVAYLLLKYAKFGAFSYFKFETPKEWNIGKRAWALVASLTSWVIVAGWLLYSIVNWIESVQYSDYFKKPAKW